jgi:hypothetical protein
MPSPRRFRRQQFSDSIRRTIDANYTGMSLRERTRPELRIIARVCHRQRRRRLPGQGGCTNSSMTASAFSPDAILRAFGS